MDRQELLYNILKKARYNRPDLISEGTLDCDVDNNEYWKVIFNKRFAIAYWGEEDLTPESLFVKTAWIYYQHEILNEIQNGKDPLKYLEKFL